MQMYANKDIPKKQRKTRTVANDKKTNNYKQIIITSMNMLLSYTMCYIYIYIYILLFIPNILL